MLKKITIPALGLTAIMVVAVMLSIQSEVEEKNPGLVPPAMKIQDIIRLDEINESTPNRIPGDLGPTEERFSTAEPNKEYMKYKSITGVIDMKPAKVKIFSNEDNSRTTILVSSKEISDDKTNHEFIYRDLGIWISLYSTEKESLPLDYFTSQPNEGFRVVQMNDKYQAAIQSVSQHTVDNLTVDSQLSLDMVTDTHQISIRGFMSDEQAIRIADYLSTR
jgi:hypothetical protein